jgi:hypothetical protein
MEFKINKIDTDIRRKLLDQTRDGKVHGAVEKDITIKPYSEEEETAKNRQDFKKILKDKREKKDKSSKIVVEGIKVDNLQVDGEREISQKDSLGVFVDTRK